MESFIITIARGYGSGGKNIAMGLAKTLGIKYYDRELIRLASDQHGINEALFNMQADIIKRLADSGKSCIIVGRCAHHILRDYPNVVKVFIHADLDHCIENVKEYNGVDDAEARALIARIDRERAQYHRHFTKMEWNDARNYDICLNTSKVSVEQCIDIIVSYLDIIKKIEK